MLPLRFSNYLIMSPFDLVLVPMGGIGCGTYCYFFKVLWAQVLC